MPSAIQSTLLLLAASKPASTSSAGSYVFLIILVVLFFFMYRFFMKPRQRAAQAQRQTLMTLEPGDEVLTGAGIFGTVQHIQGDRVTLWTGTGSTITVLRRTIARKLDEDDAEEGAADDHDSDRHDTWDDDDAAELELAGQNNTDETDDHDHPAPHSVDDDPTIIATGTTTGTTDAPEVNGHAGDPSPSETNTKDDDR